jgi:tRNA_anti-like
MISKRKKYFFGIAVLMLFLAVWGIYRVFQPHRNASGIEAVATLTAADLYQDFRHDESSANKKWVGKVIEVTGIISSVNESGNYVAINLRVSDDGGINCNILKKDLDGQFKSGDSITIKGECTGFLADVNLVDCIVKK